MRADVGHVTVLHRVSTYNGSGLWIAVCPLRETLSNAVI
uniref:Uncharacterized protein n=1 Tax=Anguilla anguilla TaxID=7936 RepID=A0A0E9R663_ANGAN